MGKRGTRAAPLVEASGQRGKLTWGIGAMVVAAVASVAQLVGPPELKTIGIAVAAVTGGIGIALAYAVRCPRCGRSLAAWAFREGSLSTWHEKLVEVRECPHCGHSVAEADAGRR